MSEHDHRPQRRRPTIAKEWQLAVLRKLQSESGSPTEAQRSAVAAETGLDEKWVKNWFVRQRSKLAARNRKNIPLGLSVTVPTFKVQLGHRSVSTPSSCPSPSTPNVHVEPRSNRSVSAPVYLSPPATIPTYSRDPLCNRYPDFSQFFRPQRSNTFQLSMPIAHYDHFVHPSTDIVSLPVEMNLHPCPVSFSVRLADLLGHSSTTVSSVLPHPELVYPI